MALTVVDHPIARTILTQLRDQTTPPAGFRALSLSLSTILIVEAARHFPVTQTEVQTPLEVTIGYANGAGLVAVPILRAGLGMLDAVFSLFPQTDVGYLGLERNEDTAEAGLYYSKLPNLADKIVWILDPMLATGGSALHAAEHLYAAGAADVTLICVVAAPDGVKLLTETYPSLKIVTAALDRELNDRKYILPGLGDFGDRLFGTM